MYKINHENQVLGLDDTKEEKSNLLIRRYKIHHDEFNHLRKEQLVDLANKLTSKWYKKHAKLIGIEHQETLT